MSAGAAPVTPGSARFGTVLRSEWTKLRSLRSTWWTVLAALTVCIGLSVLIAWAVVSQWDLAGDEGRAGFDAVDSSFGGLELGALAVATLGVLTITSEYSSGSIRTTFVAVPRRWLVLGAKAVVTAGLGLAVGLVVAFVSFFVGQALFATRDASVSLGDPGVLRAVLGAALFVAGCGMFGLAVGVVLRSTAGSTTVVLALLFVLPLLATAVPGDTGETIARYVTVNAAQAVTDVRPSSLALSPWAGYLAFTAQWVLLMGAGALLLRRRDA